MNLRATLVLMALLCALPNFIYGQFQCGTNGGSAFGPPASGGRDGCYPNYPGPFYIKIYPHILQKDDGSGGLSTAEVEQAISQLQDDFDAHNIFFIRSCEPINEIRDTSLFNVDPQKNSTIKCEIFSLNRHIDGIDIYFLSPEFEGGEAYGTPSTAFNVGGADALTKILSHEMGHCLGLYHTHQGIQRCRVPILNCENEDICEEGIYESFDGDCDSGDFVDDTGRDAEEDKWLRDVVDSVTCEYTGSLHNPDTRNIMSYTHLTCMEHFTSGQGLRARYILATDPILQSVQNQTLRISSDETWTADREINGTIIIESGATLTVSSTVKFPAHGGITVERGGRLLLNSGTLTKDCSTDYWRGVTVIGNSAVEQRDFFIAPSGDYPGVVSIKNGNIEYAKVGINANIGGQNNGGAIYASSANFVNNIRAVDIGQYKTFENKSYFDGCSVTGGEQGLMISETDGIRVTSSSFDNQAISAICLYDAGIRITNNNRFSGSNIAVESYTSQPITFRTSILNNQFNNNRTHININASSLINGLVISGNEFLGFAKVGIQIAGPSQYYIDDNDFYGTPQSSIYSSTIGEYRSYIEQNYFSGGRYGLLVSGQNDNLYFSCNKFIDTQADVSIFEVPGHSIGSVGSRQAGLWGVAAGNCFSVGGADITTHGNTRTFTYVAPSSNLSNCKLIPEDHITSGGNNNYFLEQNPGQSYDPCQIEGTPIACQSTAPYTEQDLACTKNKILELKTQLENAPSNSSLLNALTDFTHFKDIILTNLIEQALEQKNYPLAESLLYDEGTDQAYKQLMSLQIFQNQYQAAKQTLFNLNDATPTNQEFITVQELNLQQLQNDSFELDSLQTDWLINLAKGTSENRAYARALLLHLKELRFEDELPEEIAFRQEEERSVKNFSPLKVYPNPAQQEIWVQLPTTITAGTFLQGYNIHGQQVINLPVGVDQNRLRIPLHQLPDGLYFLKLLSHRQATHQTKLLISK